MKRQVLVMMVVLAGAGAAWAVAQEPQGRGRGGLGRGPGTFKETLGLSDAQVEQLRSLHEEQRKADIRRRADVEVARLELRSLLQATTLDERAVAAKVKQLSDLHSAGLRARVDGLLGMRKVLSPEQQERLRELAPLRMRGWGGGWARPGRGDGARRWRGSERGEAVPDDGPALADADDPGAEDIPLEALTGIEAE